ncbi:hypothetical protein EG359_05025 [Chryseobacterium joostei]|uniref:Uncharacterized protein n=1 Tax=Chryseobacterium joostei TaxID=112234 RepID=A0A1N7HV27_9FLAO|nr:hypothetical protein [Chryseobacterium joostei]AZA99005.1 hypothetical protein EG359_05025 [Chryseobacterium joostei]SIS28693.1 hypothetical protein SAMN05421768_101357 [Chryseobacterium joostei]
MKKELKRKILLTLSIIASTVMLIGFIFYTKPPIVITEMKPQRNISEKINPMFSDTSDSVLVLIPYKITVSNNRFRKISLPDIYYKTNHDKYIASSSSTGNSLNFDEDGKQLDEDLIMTNSEKVNYNEMSLAMKWDKWKEANRNIIFPFCSKSFYFYKSTMLKYKTERKTFVDLYNNFKEKQTQSLSETPIVRFPKNKIDSLYQADKNKKIAFKLKTNKIQGWFQIHYQMKDGTQKFYDMYDSIQKMNREELFRLMSSSPLDNL